MTPTRIPASSAVSLLGSAFLCMLFGACAPRTVVMVRDAHDTIVAGRALGGYTKDEDVRRATTVTTRVSDVRTGDEVSVRAVGAYRDPANPNLLHDPHRVYRLDHGARWRLAPAADAPSVHRGPAVALRRSEYAPGATRGESGREIMASRRAIERAADTVGLVERQQADMARGVESASLALARNQENLLKLNQKLAERVDKLEARPVSTPGQRVPLTNGSGVLGGSTPAPTPGLTSPPTVGPSAPVSSPPSNGVY